MESRDSKLIADGRAWRVDGRAQALVGPGLATPLVKTADAIMFSDHAIMHDSFSIVAAITAILIPNLLLQVYAYLKSSVVASRCLISSDHVLSTEIWKLFSSLEHKVMKKTKPS